jgi:hypothetical protein
MNTSQMNAEIIAQVLGERVLESLDRQEAELDEKIKRLENADDDELERLREKRLQQMKQKALKAQEMKANGHGEYSTLTDTNEFFQTIKKSEKVIVHFFTPANSFCQLVDGHLGRLAPHHLETKFAKMNAEKAEFLVEKLGIWMIPCIALIKDQKVVKMIQGLDELGGTDKFSTSFLAYYLSLQDVLTYDGPIPETVTDNCNDGYARGPQTQSELEKISAIRQTIYYDSDLEDSDEDNN